MYHLQYPGIPPVAREPQMDNTAVQHLSPPPEVVTRGTCPSGWTSLQWDRMTLPLPRLTVSPQLEPRGPGSHFKDSHGNAGALQPSGALTVHM